MLKHTANLIQACIYMLNFFISKNFGCVEPSPFFGYRGKNGEQNGRMAFWTICAVQPVGRAGNLKAYFLPWTPLKRDCVDKTCLFSCRIFALLPRTSLFSQALGNRKEDALSLLALKSAVQKCINLMSIPRKEKIAV